jgi:hypothetical protein
MVSVGAKALTVLGQDGDLGRIRLARNAGLLVDPWNQGPRNQGAGNQGAKAPPRQVGFGHSALDSASHQNPRNAGTSSLNIRMKR